jgi:toxin-antitoxin system PIN domain toxin
VILPDVNLFVYAYNEAAVHHEAARTWLEDVMTREQPIALAWAVVMGFIRLVTHPAVVTTPLSPGDALDRVDEWVGREHVQLIEPGPRHLHVVRQLLEGIGVAGGLTTDAHLAALAIEYQCELVSNDADFARFPGLRWRNPLG